MVPHRDRRTTKSVLRPPAPCGLRRHRAICHVATPRSMSSIDFVAAPHIRSNGARNAIPAAFCNGKLALRLLRHRNAWFSICYSVRAIK